jgi:uroporphyrinogen-III synthase
VTVAAADRQASLQRRVLNTRARHQAQPLSDLLIEAGFQPIEVPTLELAPIWDSQAMARVLNALQEGQYRWVVVSSPNAAAYLLQALTAVAPGFDPVAAFATTRVLCGSGTAAWLAEHGIVAARVLARFSAQAAREALADESGPVLVPRAREGREELVDGLRQRQVAVDAPVLYCTRAVPPEQLMPAVEALQTGTLDAVTFASPSAVASLLEGLASLAPDAVSRLRALPAVCLGETTAEAARRLGCTLVIVARETSLPALVQAVQAAFAAFPIVQVGA